MQPRLAIEWIPDGGDSTCRVRKWMRRGVGEGIRNCVDAALLPYPQRSAPFVCNSRSVLGLLVSPTPGQPSVRHLTLRGQRLLLSRLLFDGWVPASCPTTLPATAWASLSWLWCLTWMTPLFSVKRTICYMQTRLQVSRNFWETTKAVFPV